MDLIGTAMLIRTCNTYWLLDGLLRALREPREVLTTLGLTSKPSGLLSAVLSCFGAGPVPRPVHPSPRRRFPLVKLKS